MQVTQLPPAPPEPPHVKQSAGLAKWGIMAVVLGVGIGIGAASAPKADPVPAVTVTASPEIRTETVAETPAACGLAFALDVRQEKVFQNLILNALGGGSVAEFVRLEDRIATMNARWAELANECDPGGGYSGGGA